MNTSQVESTVDDQLNLMINDRFDQVLTQLQKVKLIVAEREQKTTSINGVNTHIADQPILYFFLKTMSAFQSKESCGRI